MIITYNQFINESQANPYLPYLDQIEDSYIRKHLRNNDPAAYNNYAIKWASDNGHLEVVKVLLKDNRVDPAAYNNDVIKWASRNGHLEVVKVLLQDPRVDPSARNNYAIRWASRNGHVEVVKVLLQDTRVDPAADDNEAIRWASEKGHVEVVKVLLKDPRVDPTDDDNYAIIWASTYGHVEVVKVLADYFCGGDCLLSIDEIQQIIENTEDSEIDYVIARRNQGKIAKQQGFGDDDDLLDLF